MPNLCGPWFGHPNQNSVALNTFLVGVVNPYMVGPVRKVQTLYEWIRTQLISWYYYIPYIIVYSVQTTLSTQMETHA